MKHNITTSLFYLFISNIAILFSNITHSATITNITWFSGVASVAGTSIIPPVAPFADNVVGDSSAVIFVLQKDYTAIGPVDLVFDLIDSGGTIEYRFEEGVQNSTGVDWTQYHMELGFGVGTSFVKSAAGDGLDFDSPDYDSTVNFNPSPGFTTVTVTEDDLLATSGLHPNGAYAGNYVFHIDVPDGISSFTLRQSPIADPIPLPGSLWLFLSSLLFFKKNAIKKTLHRLNS